MKKTVKQHAAAIANAVALGAVARIEYSKIVREADLTLGECAALRTAVDGAITDMLRAQRNAIDVIRAHCQRHDPATGYYAVVTPYEIVGLIDTNIPLVLG